MKLGHWSIQIRQHHKTRRSEGIYPIPSAPFLASCTSSNPARPHGWPARPPGTRPESIALSAKRMISGPPQFPGGLQPSVALQVARHLQAAGSFKIVYLPVFAVQIAQEIIGLCLVSCCHLHQLKRIIDGPIHVYVFLHPGGGY